MTSRIKNKINNDIGLDITSVLSLRTCHACVHQPVCIAFSLFKQSIEPNLMNQDTSLKAENLAKICSLYQEKGLE